MANRWEEIWKRPTQGFQQSDINRHLIEHFEWLAEAGTNRVFVPLCGRSRDLDWLAERYGEVVGAELVESPITRFFAERELTPEITAAGGVTRYQAGPVSLLHGDVLKTSPETVGTVDALYDRAALIALPRDVRVQYAAHLATLIRPGARALLVTLHYDQTAAPGPPFSVSEAEVHALFSGDWTIETPEHSVPERLPEKFAGLAVAKCVWRLTRKSLG
ncbi:MAG: thiopurine S-methyltransferase [Myxococcota bacterium]|jgi:thiopurine S-methyltransferase